MVTGFPPRKAQKTFCCTTTGMGCTTAPPASSELYDCTIGALWGWLGAVEGWHDITAICYFVHSFEWKIWFLDPVCLTIIFCNSFRLRAISSCYFATKLKHKIQTVLRVLGIVCWFQDVFFSQTNKHLWGLQVWDLLFCLVAASPQQLLYTFSQSWEGQLTTEKQLSIHIYV